MESNWFSVLLGRSGAPLRSLGFRLIRPKCKQIVTDSELETLLRKRRKLKIKFGIDPTGSEIHLGHAVPIMLLRLFQRAGHEVYFVVGDFTARIGDPSGRSETRRDITPNDVEKNLKTYAKQISRLIDLKKTKMLRNSKWLSRMKLTEFFEILGGVSLGDIAQRDDFRARIKNGAGVSMREANYSVLMAADSLHINADIEIGGIDQLLNFMHTRKVMSAFGKKPEVILATPILEGTAGDGRKMSKSFGNYIPLVASPAKQFGSIMSIPDGLILGYFLSFGDVYEEEIRDLDRFISEKPHSAKKQLGMLIVALLHGEKKALAALSEFERKFARKEYKKSDEKKIKISFFETAFSALQIAFGGAYSNAGVRRLIEQGAVKRISEGKTDTIRNCSDAVRPGDLLKVGKTRLFRFVKR